MYRMLLAVLMIIAPSRVFAGTGKLTTNGYFNHAVSIVVLSEWEEASTVKLVYTNPDGTIVTQNVSVGNNGKKNITVPGNVKKGATVTMTGKQANGQDENNKSIDANGDGTPDTVASTASNTSGFTLSSRVVLRPVSTALFPGGNQVSLAGEFDLLNEEYILDSSLADYGVLAGRLVGESVELVTSEGDTFGIVGDIPWAMNIGAALDLIEDDLVDIEAGPVIVDIPLTTFSTNVLLNGTSYAATGSFKGTDSFMFNDVNLLHLTVSFDGADFGSIGFNLAADENVPVPAPIPALGLAAAFGYTRKLRRLISQSKALSAVRGID